MKRLCAFTILACALAGPAVASAEPQMIVSVRSGLVSGTTDAAGMRAWLGIPYAAAPVGDLRFRAPQPPHGWSGVRPSTNFGPDCMMPGPSLVPQSEDCLTLNVWAPASSDRGPHPVMVWIFGSGFRSGSAAQPGYSGAGLARHGVVFVSLNYRLGALGFLATPALSAESPQRTAGNYGVLDVIAALQWVQANIAGFGGDPKNVTVFGQSSGSETTNILTASPLARGLFQRAIGESGASFGEREPKTLTVAEREGEAFAEKFGASTAAALRALPASDFTAPDMPRFEPVIDGRVLPRDVYDIYAAGRQNDVPMLVGSNADEGQLRPGLAKAKLEESLHQKYGADTARFLELFPVASDAAAPAAQKRMMTALLGDFNVSTWATLQSRTGRAPVYQYRFETAPPPVSQGRTAPSARAQGAFHGAEIPYAFDNLDRVPRDWTESDRALARRLSAIWVSFARTGDPNPAARATGAVQAWPPVHGDHPDILRIGETATVEPRPDPGLLAGLSAFFYGPGGLFGERSKLGWIPNTEQTHP